MKSVYLAGPITGISYDDAANGWRKQIADDLQFQVVCYSPMRDCEHLSHIKKFTSLEKDYGTDPVTTASAIVARDRNDVHTCDLMIANFLGAKKGSLGTAIEFGWADAFRKPIILVMEDTGNIHEHAMITEMAGFRVNNLKDAASLAQSILLPGV